MYYYYPYSYYPAYPYAYQPQPYWRMAYHGMTPNQFDPTYLNRQLGMSMNMDQGGRPFVVDIEEATTENNTFRTAIWTGQQLQVTLMSIGVGEDIGLERHSDVDQFLRIEDGEGIVEMGDTRNNLTFRRGVEEDDAIMVPAGKWHNITNTGGSPLKLYSIYAPPEHPFGTVHRTKADAGGS